MSVPNRTRDSPATRPTFEVSGTLDTVPVQLPPTLTPGTSFAAVFRLDTCAPNLGSLTDGFFQQTLG
jgi:hypothetical protein